jgi:predicted GTPase
MQIPAKKLSDAKLVLDRERPELNPERPEDKRFYVERDWGTHEALVGEALAAVAIQRPFRWFFTGHTGSGKSTELNRIIYSEAIATNYIAHVYRVRDCLDVYNLDFTDILLGIGQSVTTIAKNREVPVTKALQERIA